MLIETKKVLWTVLSVSIILTAAFGIAVALAFPKGNSAKGPATISAVTESRPDVADEYARIPEPTPNPQETIVNTDTNKETETPVNNTNTLSSPVVIFYGDKPKQDNSSQNESAEETKATSSEQKSLAPGTVAKPYSPAPQTSSKSAAVASKKTAAKPASKSVNEYWIQAAAFSSRSRADDLQKEIASKGLSSIITVKDVDSTTWYRVRIGPYNNENEAKSWLTKIKTLAFCSEAYVSRITVQRNN